MSDLIDGLDRLSITLSEMAMPTEAKLILRARNHIAGPRDTSELEARLQRTGAIIAQLDPNIGVLVAPTIADALQSLSTLRQRIEALEAENGRLKKALLPEWFYYGDEQTSDRCRFSVHEVIDEDFLWDNRAEGEHVVEIATALSGPTIWAHVKFFTDEEKDVRQSDDNYEITEYPTEEAARQALGER